MVINQMLFERSILPVLQRFRHSHSGTGCGSAYKPFFASRASFSNPSSTVSLGHISDTTNISRHVPVRG
jgi:hypothetical protein